MTLFVQRAQDWDIVRPEDQCATHSDAIQRNGQMNEELKVQMKISAAMILITCALWINPLCASPRATATTVTVAQTARDGHRDFDFLIGSWRTHYKRLRHALSGSHVWFGCDGTSVVRTFWNGSANIEDGDLRCPHQYIGGMTLRLYNDSSHQWSLYWGTKKRGLALPAQVGHFDQSGTGDFFAADTFDNKPIIVRYRWTLHHGDHPHFEQAFSADKGSTWETNWVTDYTRASPSERAQNATR